MLYHDWGTLCPLEHLSCEKSLFWMSSDAMFELLIEYWWDSPTCMFVQLRASWSTLVVIFKFHYWFLLPVITLTISFLFIYIYLFLSFGCTVFHVRILLLQPGIDHCIPCIGAWSLNHWTTRRACSGHFRQLLFFTILAVTLPGTPVCHWFGDLAFTWESFTVPPLNFKCLVDSTPILSPDYLVTSHQTSFKIYYQVILWLPIVLWIKLLQSP